jgi:flotillin
MEKLGIVVDALEIQEIEDGTGYINNLAAPHAAAVASQARIAQAQADQEAAQRELEVAAMKAQYERDTEIRKAGFLAETEEARARASQAGPLAEAKASQEVIEQQTALAQREAELAAQRLEATVRRPADAEAYRQRAIAEADRDQAELNAQAEAFRKRALAEADRDQARFAADAEAYANTTLADAEAQAARVRADAAAHAERSTADGKADANRALAESLREGNQELIAASRIIEELPELVNAASRGIAGSNLTVLNGAAGVSEVLAGLISQGMAVLDLLRSSTAAAANGAQTPPAGPPAGKAVTS